MGKDVFIHGEMRHISTQEENPGKHLVNKYIYVILAISPLGWIGIHKLYARRWLHFAMYLIFSITAVPAVLSVFDFIKGCGEMRDDKNRIWV